MEEVKLPSCLLETQGLIQAYTMTNPSTRSTKTENGKRGRKERNKFLEKKRRKEREKLRYAYLNIAF